MGNWPGGSEARPSIKKALPTVYSIYRLVDMSLEFKNIYTSVKTS